MLAAAELRAPVLRRFHLPELDEADPGDVGPARSLSALRLTAAAAAGRSLAEARCNEVLVAGGGFEDVDCRSARFLETRFEGVTAVRVLASGSTWRASDIRQCRFGALELDGAVLGSVGLADSKCGRLNLAGARVSDVLIERCAIEECDLSAAVVQRLAFAQVDIGTLIVTGAQLTDVDLRSARIERLVAIGDLGGATITEDQLGRLAPALAQHLGIRVAAPDRG